MAGNSVKTTRLNHIAVQSSTYGVPLTIGWGTGRVSLNAIWMGQLQSSTAKASGGGKGGNQSKTYNYAASVHLAVGEGPIPGISEFFKDSSHFVDGNLHSHFSSIASALSSAGNSAMAADYTTLANLASAINTGSTTALQSAGLSLAAGNLGQAAQSFTYGSEHLGYSQTAYLYALNYGLSSSATLANHTAAVTWPIRATVSGTTIDEAHPADIITDFLTNAYYGLPQWPSGVIGDLTEYRSACQAYNFFLSPILDTQRTASDFLKEILQASNADAYWSEGVLKIRPYADTARTANGVTFTPNLTPVYSLSDDDYTQKRDEDPLTVMLKAPADAYNYIQLEYYDRTHQYNSSIMPAPDQASIDQYGERKQDPISLKCVTLPSVAASLAQVILQRTCNVLMTFKFTLPESYCLLEPMDLVEITDTYLGLNAKLVRVTSVQEDSTTGELTIEAEEMLVGASSAPAITRQGPLAVANNYDVYPGNVSSPILINPPRTITTANGMEMWLAVSGGVNWGGCEVWASLDGTNYTRQGIIEAPAKYGVLTASLASHADPDTSDTLSIDLSDSLGTLLSTSTTAADAYATMALVDDEVISYATATLTGTNTYNLTYLRRGGFSTTIAAHSSGATFVRLDDSIYKYPYTAAQVGSTVHLKFLSYNAYGQSIQDLSSVSAYTIVLDPGAAPSAHIIADSIIGQGPWATTSTPLSTVLSPTANLIFNPSGGLGGQKWTQHLGPGFNAIVLSAAEGPFWDVSSGNNATGVDQYQDVPCYPSNTYSISGEAFSGGIALTSGTTAQARIYAEWLDSSHAHISYGPVCALEHGSNWVRIFQDGFASPSTAAYARIHTDIWGNGTWTNSNAAWRRLKFEANAVHTVFSDETTNGALYQNGATIDSLQPAQFGADVTGSNNSLGFYGQGGLATRNYVQTGSGGQLYSSSYGFLTDGGIYTPLGTSAGFYGQGALATQNSIAYGSSYLTGFGSVAGQSSLALGSGYLTGFGSIAGLNTLGFGSGYVTDQRLTYLVRADGTTVVTESLIVTGIGTAAGFTGQGGLATQNSVNSSTIDANSVGATHISNNGTLNATIYYASSVVGNGTEQDVFNQTVSLTTSGLLEVIFNCYVQNSTGAATAYNFRVYLNGTQVRVISASNSNTTATVYYAVIASSGSNTIRITFDGAAATGGGGGSTGPFVCANPIMTLKAFNKTS